ncbi:MAG TPA: membrane or secreted protein [Thermoanaerobaculia bacterium]
MTFLSLILAILFSTSQPAATPDIEGAWQLTTTDGSTATLIVSDGHFAIAHYQKEPAKFLGTQGGTIVSGGDGTIKATYEFNTQTPEKVGKTDVISLSLEGDVLTADGDHKWTRIDDGTPGALEGAWLITGHKNDKGEITKRKPGARRTMKILSGTRFQWIAYNVETKEFFGTGGGTYTTKDGAYTENIEFFSRDDKKAGMSLPFKYSVTDGDWHHEGKSTKGDPMFEVWEKRGKLGI